MKTTAVGLEEIRGEEREEGVDCNGDIEVKQEERSATCICDITSRVMAFILWGDVVADSAQLLKEYFRSHNIRK